ncbi:MAG: 2-hydroxyacid dehydrogenase [Chitinophagaceae bacterium]|nr:2-hydroxyacid dehydrogenase [Chitinophagaceae bacterium]
MAKITFFSAQPYDIQFFEQENIQHGFELDFFDVQLRSHTVQLAEGATVVCIFVNDHCHSGIIEKLAAQGVQLIALRCAGFNNVDLQAAAAHGMRVVRVPAYSPQAVAEHAVALLMTLNRKTHKAYNRVREQNFALNGLLGFDVYGKTVGVVGTGNIGQAFARIMLGFGCRVLAFDLVANQELTALGVEYTDLGYLFADSDIISLHCPLNDHTRHLINADSLGQMKKGVVLINTSRGGLVNSRDAINALKSGQLGALGIDVYEQEEKLFFRDLSSNIIQDDVIQRLMSFPNVLITAHQAFFTREALTQIAQTTLGNVQRFLEGQLHNEVRI